MMSVSSKSNRPGFKISRSVSSSRRPVIDAMNGGIAKPLLKPRCIFSQIMQQPGQSGFIGKI